LGITLSSIDEKQIEIERFNQENLKELYMETQNPLWLILRIIKPIDETFTLEQKIEAYYDVIEQIKNNSLKLGDRTTPIQQARTLADQALTVVKQYETEKGISALENNDDLLQTMQKISNSIRSTTFERATKGLNHIAHRETPETIGRKYKSFLSKNAVATELGIKELLDNIKNSSSHDSTETKFSSNTNDSQSMKNK